MQPQAPGPTMPSMQAPQPNYDFIVNPGAAPKKPAFNLNGTSLIGRILIVLIVLFVVMLLFVVVKSVTAKPSTTAYFVAIAQDQALLLHIAADAQQQQGVKTATLNSAVTVNASVTSAQTTLATYMSSIHAKVTTKQTALKIKPSLDTTLANSATTGTYDTTYKTVMNDALGAYLQDLKTAYNHVTGPRGRAELSSEYASAQLLVKQLN